jgi:hypothetical protein
MPTPAFTDFIPLGKLKFIDEEPFTERVNNAIIEVQSDVKLKDDKYVL